MPRPGRQHSARRAALARFLDGTGTVHVVFGYQPAQVRPLEDRGGLSASAIDVGRLLDRSGNPCSTTMPKKRPMVLWSYDRSCRTGQD